MPQLLDNVVPLLKNSSETDENPPISGKITPIFMVFFIDIMGIKINPKIQMEAIFYLTSCACINQGHALPIPSMFQIM